MLKHRKTRITTALALLAVLLVSAMGVTVFAHNSASTATPQGAVSVKAAARGVQVVSHHLVDMSKAPAATKAQLAQASRTLPAMYRQGTKAHEQAQHSNRGQNAPHNAGMTPITTASKSIDLPSTFNKWNGQQDSAATCPPGGCQPPDMALAASPAGLVMQGVNTSFAVYNLTGTVQTGWPKTAQTFFGIPNPGACDPNGAFVSDPRLWWDSYDNRWVAAILQVEGAWGISCPFQTTYWVAASMSPNPSGTWNVFAINMAFGSDSTGAADFTQIGVNGDGIYVSANVFNNAGSAYDYAEIVGCGKTKIYQGYAPTCNAWYNLTAGGALLDTVQPSGNTSTDFGPRTEYFVSSFSGPDANGHDCFSTACNGVAVFSWSDPANTTGSGNKFSGVWIPTAHNYIAPPGADQPSCTAGGGCVDGGDLRVSATAVYHAGHVFAAHVTGITNGASQFVPGIQWWDIVPTLNPGYPTTMTGASLAQDGLLNANSNYTALTYPAMMVTADNDIIMGYDYMGDTIYPSINFTSRRQSDPASVMTGGLGIIAVSGTVSTSNTRWGDYEAMSYTAPYQDFIWFSAQYANPSAGGDWITSVMRLRLNINS
ncbi:MAG: hypothetical protein OJF49_002039 [Ktedonobacterales bacterium]|jgi:hypothetical protein|nr:MAG: hypothetical protein OJF49_002039 [Ktedonobacterales bacterium]